jgi:hypothetical protein
VYSSRHSYIQQEMEISGERDVLTGVFLMKNQGNRRIGRWVGRLARNRTVSAFSCGTDRPSAHTNSVVQWSEFG